LSSLIHKKRQLRRELDNDARRKYILDLKVQNEFDHMVKNNSETELSRGFEGEHEATGIVNVLDHVESIR
jgi:hypothetical protein